MKPSKGWELEYALDFTKIKGKWYVQLKSGQVRTLRFVLAQATAEAVRIGYEKGTSKYICTNCQREVESGQTIGLVSEQIRKAQRQAVEDFAEKLKLKMPAYELIETIDQLLESSNV